MRADSEDRLSWGLGCKPRIAVGLTGYAAGPRGRTRQTGCLEGKLVAGPYLWDDFAALNSPTQSCLLHWSRSPLHPPWSSRTRLHNPFTRGALLLHAADVRSHRIGQTWIGDIRTTRDQGAGSTRAMEKSALNWWGVRPASPRIQACYLCTYLPRRLPRTRHKPAAAHLLALVAAIASPAHKPSSVRLAQCFCCIVRFFAGCAGLQHSPS